MANRTSVGFGRIVPLVLISVLLLTSSVMAGSPAGAPDYHSSEYALSNGGSTAYVNPWNIGVVMLSIPTFILEFTGGIFTVGNFTYVVKGYRPSAGWRVPGYVFSGLNLAVGALWLIAASELYDGDSDFITTYSFRVGLSAAIMGGLGLGFTIWASAQPEWSKRQGSDLALSINPVVIPDSRGQPVMGLGLSMVGW